MSGGLVDIKIDDIKSRCSALQVRMRAKLNESSGGAGVGLSRLRPEERRTSSIILLVTVAIYLSSFNVTRAYTQHLLQSSVFACNIQRVQRLDMSPQRYERVRVLPPPLTAPLSNSTSIDTLDTDRYRSQVSETDQDDTPMTPIAHLHDAPNSSASPPPSFRSRASSPSSQHFLTSQDPLAADAERTLNDTFNDGSDSEDEHTGDDRQRLMRSNTAHSTTEQQNNSVRPPLPRNITTLPPPNTPAALGAALAAPTRRPAAFNQSQNDGVFANLDAKPEKGEKLEELPPVSLSSSLHFLEYKLNLV